MQLCEVSPETHCCVCVCVHVLCVHVLCVHVCVCACVVCTNMLAYHDCMQISLHYLCVTLTSQTSTYVRIVNVALYKHTNVHISFLVLL